MTYRFLPGQIYRMPTHFGPAPGPRQLPSDLARDAKTSPQRLSISASFLTDPKALEAHTPEGFSLHGDPVVSVEFHYMNGIDWLAGRGYTMIHVGWPVQFTGRRDRALGKFLAVVWENLADPIISGRDEIGHPKLYAEIEPPRFWDATYHCCAQWMGFRFLELKVSGIENKTEIEEAPASDGTLMLKYLPQTGAWGDAAQMQVTLTPAADPDRRVLSHQSGNAELRFHSATWSDLPTMAHVTNALAALPIEVMRAAKIVRSQGGKTYRDQRVLV